MATLSVVIRRKLSVVAYVRNPADHTVRTPTDLRRFRLLPLGCVTQARPEIVDIIACGCFSLYFADDNDTLGGGP
jgi:hypothetical protein